MPKPFLPPQGGEKWLCLGMFLTLMFSVIMIVVVIYCIVIIYDPSVKEIYSEINPEPKRCSTTFVERNITGTPEDQKCNWSSCEEWCLSKGASPCSKVSVNVPWRPEHYITPPVCPHPECLIAPPLYIRRLSRSTA